MLAAPLTERIDFSLEVTHETMSGASPWYTAPDAAGSPIQILSGATIEDKRNDILLTTNYYYDNARLGLTTGYSTENDYTAINVGFDGETHFNEKNTTLSGGIGLSIDEIEPTDPQLDATRPTHENKQTYGLNVGLAQILNRRLGRAVEPLVRLRHRLSLGSVQEGVPVRRHVLPGRAARRLATRSRWLTRYRRHIEEFEATMHLSYQYYRDTWGVSSHTIEFAWYQSYGDNLQITPIGPLLHAERSRHLRELSPDHATPGTASSRATTGSPRTARSGSA